MSRYTDVVLVECPSCQETVLIALNVFHDPGCWRTTNGDGWPESWEVDVTTNHCPECQTSTDTEDWQTRIDKAFASHERPEREDYE